MCQKIELRDLSVEMWNLELEGFSNLRRLTLSIIERFLEFKYSLSHQQVGKFHRSTPETQTPHLDDIHSYRLLCVLSSLGQDGRGIVQRNI